MSLNGQTAVVTGANCGLGRSVAELLARAGAHVTMVCRNRERGEQARAGVQRAGAAAGAEVRLELADLSRQTEVRALAGRLAASLPAIDVLVNNAGVWLHRRQLSTGGFELMFATNYLSHFLLTHRLLDPLTAGRGRVVNVGSHAHRYGDLRRAGLEAIARGEAWRRGFEAYGNSKLGNILFTFESVRRWGERGITANTLHPGTLATRIWRGNLSPRARLMGMTRSLLPRPEVGARAVMRLVDDPARDDVTGRYFKLEREESAHVQAYDTDLARQLWERSLEWTAET
ncbi:SDR family NAD(P)-dependent oxidoreductase [Candidatus Palauibacter sp.]|uniref:SDR family NAD(P)-dependent oxidoreductase n=1 Tax=Candidatus Palauibacter sp. TaxID=3101350 RepID=UPI003B01EC94